MIVSMTKSQRHSFRCRLARDGKNSLRITQVAKATHFHAKRQSAKSPQARAGNLRRIELSSFAANLFAFHGSN
jgi:hypothetical protein